MLPPLIFLDFDGVMNNFETMREPGGREVFSIEAGIALRQILGRTHAQIVISSSWREDVAERIPIALQHNGLASCVERIVGHTPIIPDAPPRTRRADEIDAWLEIHPARRNRFLILDDDDMTPELRARHIQTDPAIGLTLAHVPLAIGILGG